MSPAEPACHVAILTPTGRDAVVTTELLGRGGLLCRICADVAAMIAALDAGAESAMIAEEALYARAALDRLASWVGQQRPWSDMPFVILTSRAAGPEVVAWRQHLLVVLRNASLLERPLDAVTLTSAVAAARRGRLRQFELRSYVAERASEAERLEALVRERTAELRLQMAERARAEDALRQAQKMEAVGQLTGGLAHDFNNLLAGISGALELMTTRVAQGRTGELNRYLTAAQGACRRAAALTHRLLAFSRRQTLDPRPTDLNRLVGDMADLVRRTIGPAIALEVEAAGDLWVTLVDPNQLENALLNLCINARDAMPDGGRLTVTTGNATLDAAEAASLELTPGQFVALRVADTGTGMPPHVVARAFDPFFTTKPLGQGTGLGLSMIYGFARQSGGQARIVSALGEGTAVWLYLPRHGGVADPAGENPGSAGLAMDGHGETVLLVDDEPTLRMLATEVLGDLGYIAIDAADGAAGLGVLRSGARVDLLVTDVGLPGGMNGRQLADAGRALRPGLRVLFITGYADNAAVGDGLLEPGMQVLTKPFEMEAFAAAVRELVAGGRAA